MERHCGRGSDGGASAGSWRQPARRPGDDAAVAQTRRWALATLALVGLACGPKQAPSTPPVVAAQAPTFENPGGMWMPSQLVDHAETLKALGVELPDGALTDPMAFPLGAVVSLGGCSASFVSPEGLVVTNHHCATGYLQANSAPERNLLEEGYLAASKADEKPGGPRARIYVTQSITDVTAKVLEGTDVIEGDADRAAAIAARKLSLTSACDARDATTSCTVASYFDGAQYFEIERLEIRDVRLVYAPHHGVGVFGGDVDNWRWPRHTGDYSFIRAYVGPDGKPADPAPDNVPYKPKHFLKVASEPLAAGDFVMVAGYPGRTYRLKTAAEVDGAVAWRYPREIVRYDEIIGLMEALGKDDPAIAIKAASQLKRLKNYRTNFQGMIDGLREGGLAAEKANVERGLQAWIDAEPTRKNAYGSVLADMVAERAKLADTRDHDAAIGDLTRAGELLEVALGLAGLATLRDKLGADEPRVVQATEQLRNTFAGLDARYDAKLDIALLAHAAGRAALLPEAQRPDAVLEAFFGPRKWAKFSAAPDAIARKIAIEGAVSTMIAKTKVANADARAALLDSLDSAKLAKSRDPLLAAARRMLPSLAELQARKAAYDGAMAKLRPRYVQALREFSTTPLAPDANGTLRVTYGTVRGYKATPGAETYVPFSTVAEMVAKNTGVVPFAAPQGILDAVKRADWGPYADEAVGGLPLDFLADLDITGGNSGSATLNARGELVGLAFDGNYESIASDWLFLPSVTSSIHVDIRYVLWIMDAVDNADHLLIEMGVTPAIEAPQSVQAQSSSPSSASAG
ncbi:MAG: S46 family peptidase [Nannocystaceae bacterium]|nr:S46 family peptidase [Nannocystaceae bacterium]